MSELLNRCAQGFQGPFRDQNFMSHSPNIGFFLLFMIGAFLLVFFIKFSVAWIVYKDALAKNIENRKLWFFIVFVTSVLGVIFYFVMVIYQHKNNTSPLITQNQPAVSNPVQIVSTNKTCKNCGTIGDGKFCSKCGTQL